MIKNSFSYFITKFPHYLFILYPNIITKFTIAINNLCIEQFSTLFNYCYDIPFDFT